MADEFWKKLEDMTPEEREEFGKEAKAISDRVMAESEGDAITCVQCSLQTPIVRDGNSWTAECRCGWSAAGSGPRPLN